MITRIIPFLAIMMVSFPAFSADVSIDMLNKQGKEKMVFSKKIVYVDVGDTVSWKSKDKGHNVEFVRKKGVPKGVKKFKSRISKDTSYKFTVPGIYAYWCSPHKTLGMVGFVVVGKDKSNLAAIKKVKFAGKSKKVAKKLIAELSK